jgi:hypothetical protein
MRLQTVATWHLRTRLAEEDSAMNTTLTVMLLVGVGLGQTAGGSTADNPDDKAEAAQARAVAKMMAAEYVFQLDRTSGQELQREREPILRWLLHLDRRFHSDVYVWTHEGRPEVVAGITNVYGNRRAMETEIHSLSTGLPLMSHDGKVVWEPERPGVEWKPMPEAAKPGSTAAARLSQMRSIAAQYTVTGVYGGMKEDLRLLTAPIYRYASAKQDVTDGAIFAFARGTDPDALLMIEARAGGDQWQHTFVRFCGHCSLRAVREGREVWQVDVLPARVNTDPKQPYFGLRRYSDFPVVK